MKSILSLIAIMVAVAGCGSAPPKDTTVVVVPKDSKTVVVCDDGTQPPCH